MMNTRTVTASSGKSSRPGLWLTLMPLEVATSLKRPIVLSGPSGAGKSTLLKRLLANHPNDFGFNTTRQPRPGEIDGREYNFVSRPTFESLISSNAFIEWAQYSSNLYGTSVEAVKRVQALGKICILDIDLQGVKSVKATDLDARFVFVKPPNVKALEERLRARGTETEDSLTTRLDLAQKELEYAEIPDSHDAIIVNDDLDRAYEELVAFIYGKKAPN